MYSTGTAHNEANVYKLQEARELIEAQGNDALRDAYFPSAEAKKEKKEERETEQDQSATLAGAEIGVRGFIAVTNSDPLPSIAEFAAKRIAALIAA